MVSKMNERIKELADRAGLKVESWMTNPPKPFQILGSTEQFEKFAELIVRECMKLNRDILCEDDPDYLDQVYKEHFGVEE